MCNYSESAKIISLIYLCVTVGLPILYLFVYVNKVKKKKKKNYIKAVFIAIIMFSLMFSVKMIAKLTDKSCVDCYINNNCKKEDNKVTTTTTTTSTTETTTTTTTEATTEKSTTKKITTTKKYENVPGVTGERKDVGKTDKGYTIYEIDGITYIDGIIIANKTYSLPNSYNPGGLTKTFNSNFNKMKEDAAKEGIKIWVVSGYRSYATQNKLYNNYVNRDGKVAADTYSARPGHSEHQLGLAADLNTASSSAHFENTKEYKWLINNCYKYGFILRYLEGKKDVTGYKYEPWHYRYVGEELATKIYNDGNWTTLEEYFGITSEYKD